VTDPLIGANFFLDDPREEFFQLKDLLGDLFGFIFAETIDN